jgi:deoxyribodipyrimidine photolyase-related protein
MSANSVRQLVLVLGDQLALDASAFDDFDPATDAVWMAEVAEESTHVRSSKTRSTLFLSAMRHFAQTLRDAGRRVHYLELDDPQNPGTLAAALSQTIAALRPARLVLTAPGDWRVLTALRACAAGGVLESPKTKTPFVVR